MLINDTSHFRICKVALHLHYGRLHGYDPQAVRSLKLNRVINRKNPVSSIHLSIFTEGLEGEEQLEENDDV